MTSETAVHAERSVHAVIANITEQSYMTQRTYGTFQIAGRALGEEYALTRVTPRTAVMDYGDKRILPLAITAREIAEDLCREVNSDAGERSFLGVFVCGGDTPTEDELRNARARPGIWALTRNGITRRAKQQSVPVAVSGSSPALLCANRAARFSTVRRRWHSGCSSHQQERPPRSRWILLRSGIPRASPNTCQRRTRLPVARFQSTGPCTEEPCESRLTVRGNSRAAGAGQDPSTREIREI